MFYYTANSAIIIRTVKRSYVMKTATFREAEDWMNTIESEITKTTKSTEITAL